MSSNKVFYKYNGTTYTYLDLKQKVYSFISFLHKRKKLKNNKICVISEKSFNSYSLVVSILLTNNIWIPLSSKIPKYRLMKMLKQVNPDIVITDNQNLINSFNFKKKKNFFLIKDINKFKINKSKKINISHNPNDLAMIFFTSGSTGEAKGVPIKQSNFLPSFFSQINKIYKKNKNLVFADFHDLSFVISLNILLPCIYLQSTIVPAKSNFDTIFPQDHLIKNNINVLVTVPSFMNQIKNILNKKKYLDKLKIVIMCGETFHLNLLKFLTDKCNKSKIYNCYGSTELSPWVFSYELKRKDLNIIKKFKTIPIGKKFNFVKYKISNRELLISGPSVVDGYLKKNLDKDKFIIDKKNKWYKTGDIAIKSNNLVFLKGRKDTQIKIHGFRVDLLDIENTLRINKNISNAIILVKNNNKYSKKIIAIVESKKILNKNVIVNYLKNKLAYYMMPHEYIFFKNFPKNKNGKIDRAKILKKIL